MSDFPLDDATLILLAAACEINPDSGHSELGTFLHMGSRVKSVTNEETGDTYPDMETALADVKEGDVPVFFVENEEGYEPFSPQHVIRVLIGEIFRLRGPYRDIAVIASDERRSDEYLGNYVRVVVSKFPAESGPS